MTARQARKARRAAEREARKLADKQQTICEAKLAAIQRLMSAAERGFHKALTTLRQLQKERGSRSESASALGFVPTASVQPDGFVFSTSPEPAIGFVPQNWTEPQSRAA